MVHRWILCCSLLALVRVGLCSQIVPPLYRYDDFFQCQRGSYPGEFCFVKVVLNDDRQFFDSSKIVSDFRHNLLDWGVCIADCQRELAHVSVEERQRLFQPELQVNFTYILPDHWGSYAENFKKRYAPLISVCINNRLQRMVNHSQLAYTEIEYCTTQDALVSKLRKTPELVTAAFYVALLTLIGLVVGANLVERFGRDQDREHIIVSSFSLRRNWKRLTEQSKSEVYRDFGYLDGIRVYANFFLMIVHILMVACIIPADNPEYSEQLVKNPLLIDVTTLAPFGVQIFFVMGGLLLAITVLKEIERKAQLQDDYIWTKTRSRLIRILPVYYFCLLIALMGDDLPGVQLGPVGYKSLIQEQGRCRKKWWTSVLFLNNIATFGEQRCNVHTWYLSADMQLFIASLVLLLALGKYPKRSKAILWTCATMSLIIPTGIVYNLGLTSAPPISLSEAQFGFMHNPWINSVYMPSYSNMNSYLAGVVVGYLYHQMKHHKLNLDNSLLYGAIKRLSIPLLAAAYLPTFIFYKYEIPRSSFLTVLHSFLYSNAGILALSICFIEGFRNPPGRIRAHLSSPVLTTLGRLVFCVYLLHFTVIRLVVNQFPPDYVLNILNLLWIPVGIAALSYLAGLVGFLVVEQPLGLLLKHWLDGDRRKAKLA